MAITNADGSIILSTKIDTKGLEDAMAKMRQQAKGTGSAFESLSNAIKVQETRLDSLRQQYASYVIRNEQGSAAAKKLSKDIKVLSGSLAQNQQRLVAASASAVSFGAKAKTAIAGVGTSLKVLASYLIGIQTIFATINFSKAGAEFATQTEASVQRLVDIYGSASDAVGDFIDANARALGMSKSAAASFSSVYGNLFSVWADQATNAELTNRYLNMTAVVASKTGRTVEDVQERVRSGLLGNTEAIEDLGIFVNVKTIEMTDAFQRMANGKSWEQLDAYTQQQIRSMAILEQATAKYGDEVADTSATIRNQFNAAYQDFQNSWGKIVNQVLLPVLQTLTEIFNIATAGLNALSGRSGKILENVELQEEDTDKTAENIEEQTKNQKELNKELKKTTTSFDTVEILSSQTAENTSSGGLNSDLQGLGSDFGGSLDGSSYVDEVDETLTAIMGIVALSLAAVGLILLFTGNIGWGVGFIIAGAATLPVTMATASEFGYDGIIQMLTTIMGVAGGALLALGIILLWIGGVVGAPIAIGMIIAGGALIVSSVAAQAAFAPDDIAAWLSSIMGIAGGALLALGIILCMVGYVPLGVGMIIAGTVSLVSAVALNSDAIVEAIRGPIGIIAAIVSGALLVLGIILTCSGMLPLGIGLIAAGAIGLATVVAINWNAILEALQGPIGTITAIVSGALLVLGIILVCTGVGIPLGIGLILAGAAGLTTVVAVNWDAIVGWVKGAFEKVKEWISMYGGLVLGIILLFSGVGVAFGLALIIDSISSISKGEKPALWDSILESIKKTWNDIKSYWNANIANVWTLKFWLDLAKIAGNGLIDGFELAINGIIGMFEKMINWIVDGLNKISFDIPDWLGGGSFGINLPRAYLGRVKIPRLAQGAVIPPNREFLAVLGDQRKGTNIETPIATMVEAFQMALDSRGGYSGGNTEVILEIDGREFGRAVVEQGNRENRRIGTRLVIG